MSQFFVSPRVTGMMPLEGRNKELLPAEVLYRYKETRVGSTLHLFLERYEVLRRTPQGYWIRDGFASERWVNGVSEKRFAYPTKAAALYSYYRRKNRQVEILEYNLALAKEARYVGLGTPRPVPYRFVLEREWY